MIDVEKKIKNRLYKFNSIKWVVGFTNGKFIVSPFITNYDNTEIMDLVTNARYVSSEGTIDYVIKNVMKSKADDLKVVSIYNGYEIESRTEFINFNFDYRTSNKYLQVNEEDKIKWYLTKKVDLTELKMMSKLYEDFFDKEYKQEMLIIDSRNFGAKYKKEYKFPYTDFSTEFEFGDIFWAVVKDNVNCDILPIVFIESVDILKYCIKILTTKAKYEINKCNNMDKKELLIKLLNKMYKENNKIEILNGSQIEKYSLLNNQIDNHNKILDEMNKRNYSYESIINLTKLYKEKAKSKQTQKTLDNYEK